MLKALRLWAGAAAALVLCACASAPQFGAHPALFVARDADSTMYLFGTVHVRRPGADWGGPVAQAALGEADEVWTEVMITPEAEARAQAVMARLGAAAPEQPLSRLLSAEENARLDALTQRLGMSRAALEHMQPWIAALTLSVIPLMQAGYDPQAGADRAIDAAADAQGKTMRALETVEDQLGMLAGLPIEVQRQMLLDAIDNAAEGAASMDAMSAAWEAGDLSALERAVLEDMRAEYPELFEAVFTRRNLAWLDILMRELDGAGVDFVAVGAGHLLGEEGLVALLAARGVAVERVE